MKRQGSSSYDMKLELRIKRSVKKDISTIKREIEIKIKDN